MVKYRIKNHIIGRYNQDKEVYNDSLVVNDNQSRLRSKGQAVSHLLKNPNASLIPDFCANNVVQKNSVSSTIIPSSSESKIRPKTDLRDIKKLIHLDARVRQPR